MTIGWTNIVKVAYVVKLNVGQIKRFQTQKRHVWMKTVD